MHTLNLSYQYDYRNETRTLSVAYVAGAVTVTEADGTVFRLTYRDGALTGSRLTDSHRRGIAELLRVAIEQADATAAMFGGMV
jgi:hypothetical protein